MWMIPEAVRMEIMESMPGGNGTASEASASGNGGGPAVWKYIPTIYYG